MTILIETSYDDVDIELLVSYVVKNAKWSPKYDIRVDSNQKIMTVTTNR